MSEKSTFGSGSNAGASFSLSAQAIKFDKLPKLIGASDFRTWHDTAKMILEALDL